MEQNKVILSMLLNRLISSWQRDDYFSGYQRKELENRILISLGENDQVVTVSGGKAIQLWDLLTGNSVPISTPEIINITAVKIDPSGDLSIGKENGILES